MTQTQKTFSLLVFSSIKASSFTANQLPRVRVNLGLAPMYSLNLANEADNGHDWLLLFVLHC